MNISVMCWRATVFTKLYIIKHSWIKFSARASQPRLSWTEFMCEKRKNVNPFLFPDVEQISDWYLGKLPLRNAHTMFRLFVWLFLTETCVWDPESCYKSLVYSQEPLCAFHWLLWHACASGKQESCIYLSTSCHPMFYIVYQGCMMWWWNINIVIHVPEYQSFSQRLYIYIIIVSRWIKQMIGNICFELFYRLVDH